MGATSTAGGHIRILHLSGFLSLVAWIAVASLSADVSRCSALILWLAAQALGWIALGAVASLGPDRPGRWAVLAWAASFRLVGLFSAPVLEDDPFRYLWDGRTFVVSGNPFRDPPSAAYGDPRLPEAFQSILDQVNHPELRTVYGPVAQLGFAASHLVAPGRLWPWKLLLFGAEALSWFAWRGRLGRRGLLLMTWCPLAVAETAFNAHPEALGIALLSWGLSCRSPAVSGACLAMSGAAKALGWILAPAILARRGIKAWVAFVVMLSVLYLPFLPESPGMEFESLRIMASQWSFNASLVPLLGSFLGDPVARKICMGLFLLMVAAALVRHARGGGPAAVSTVLPDRLAQGIFGAFFLLSAAVNPWYLLWLLPFASSSPSPVAIAALVAIPLSYCTGENLTLSDLDPHGQPLWVPVLEYGAVAVAAWLGRDPRSREVKGPESPKG